MKCTTAFLLRSLILLVAGIGEVPLQAEEVWLEPERLGVTPGAKMTLSLRAGDGFHAVGRAVEVGRVASAVARIGTEMLVVTAPATGDGTSRFSVTLPRPGFVRIAIELKERDLEFTAAGVEARLRALNAGGSLREEWAASSGIGRWRETEVRRATVFVRVGEPDSADQSWGAALGLGLEIVPEADPTALQAGGAFPVRVLQGGVPLADCVVRCVSRGEIYEHVLVTDESGRAVAPLAVAGTWLLRGIHLRRSSARERDWESETAALTVEVK